MGADSNSLVRDFIERIRLAENDKANERFVREHLAGIVQNCPYSILAQIGTFVVELRKAELREDASRN